MNCKECAKFKTCEKAKNPENYAFPNCKDFQAKTMRDRLIELIRQAEHKCSAMANCKRCEHYGLGEDCQRAKIADHLLANGVIVVDTDIISTKKRPLISKIAGYSIDDVIDIIRAKEADRIIVPPCKVGDTVYSYSGDFGVVLPYFIENLNIAYLNDDKLCYTYEANCSNEDELLDGIDFDLEDIGKTVFLTKEEAEKALKGGVSK